MKYIKRIRFGISLLLSFSLLLPNSTLYSQIKDTGTTEKPNTSTNAANNAAEKPQAPAPNGGNNKSADANKTTETAKPTTVSDNIDSAEVLWVNTVNSPPTSTYSSAGLEDIIFIKVSHFNNLLQRKTNSHQNISLYINDRRIDNILPISGAPDKDSGTFQYKLDRNTGNDKIWADILGSPSIKEGNGFFYKQVKISVGLDSEYAIRTSSGTNNFFLIRIHRTWFWSCCIIILIYLFVFISMVRYRGLLRDRGIDLSAVGISNNSKSNPYSLGRCQMAFWFTITIISFFFIWLITDAYNIISTTVLALIGISAGTSLSAAIIDNNKSTDLLNQTITLQDELAKLNLDISALQIAIANQPIAANIVTLQNDLSTKQARIAQIPTLIANNKVILTPQLSQGFLNDILTDINGVSFHRLQMFVWTLVLGLIFLYSVWKSLSMPDFDATLLALQGLTAGTYLGFKFPEKQA